MGQAQPRTDSGATANILLVVGKFDNRSSYMHGMFSDGVDRLGSQAKTILIGHLQETGRFNVIDRDNMDEIAREFPALPHSWADPNSAARGLRGADSLFVGTLRRLELYDLFHPRQKSKPLPPGWHAQLGYAYFQLGKLDQAKQEFEAEKAAFPQSAVFMDRLSANLKKP